MRPLLADCQARGVVLGHAVSMVGDAFSLVAVPMLLVGLTGSATSIGIAMLCAALPRVSLILYGGRLADGNAARKVLIRTRCANGAVLGLLALAAFTEGLSPYGLYAASAALGALSAFAYPAGAAVIPQLVPAPLQGQVVTLVHGLRHACTLLGTLAAGTLIEWIGHQDSSSPAAASPGLRMALLVDAASFVLAALLLASARDRATMACPAPATRPAAAGALLDALRCWWRDLELRVVFLYFSVISVLFGASMQVGLPLLANRLSHEGAAGLSWLLAWQGSGMLVGSFMPAVVSHIGLPAARFGWLLLGFDAAGGGILIGLGLAPSIGSAGLWLAAMGLLGGLLQQRSQRYLLRRLPRDMFGRLMSLQMFMVMSTLPPVAILAGLLAGGHGVRMLLVGAGLSTLVVVALAAGLTAVRKLE